MKYYPRLQADSGRIAANRDIATGSIEMALFEAPTELRSPDEPVLLLAASSAAPGWRRRQIEVSHGGRIHSACTAARKSTLGFLMTALGDQDETIDVALHDPEQWLVSCSSSDIWLGDNLAMIGREAIQFAQARSLGEGRFRLRELRRGCAGSPTARHAKGEPFVLIERAALEPIRLPVWVPREPVYAATRDGGAQCSLTPAIEGRDPIFAKLKL